MWDTNTPFGKRIEERLNEEKVIWLVTQGKDGLPEPSPVWFLRENNDLLIFSKPNAPKVRNIQQHPSVALHFNTTVDGDDVEIFHGEASIDTEAPPANQIAAYIEKYQEGLRNLQMEEHVFAQDYSAAIRIRLRKVRGFL